MKDRINEPNESIEVHNSQVDGHEWLEVVLFEELRKLLHFCCFVLYNYYIIVGDAALIAQIYIFARTLLIERGIRSQTTNGLLFMAECRVIRTRKMCA